MNPYTRSSWGSSPLVAPALAILFLAAATLATSTPVSAHERSVATLDLRPAGTTFDGTLEMSNEDVEEILDPAAQLKLARGGDEGRDLSASIRAAHRDWLRLEVDREACESEVDRVERVGVSGVRVALRFDCPTGEKLHLRWLASDLTILDLETDVVLKTAAGPTQEASVSRASPQADFNLQVGEPAGQMPLVLAASLGLLGLVGFGVYRWQCATSD